MIEYKNVVLRYTEKDILKDVNLRIENGEFMVLVGPSGSGKNSLVTFRKKSQETVFIGQRSQSPKIILI